MTTKAYKHQPVDVQLPKKFNPVVTLRTIGVVVNYDDRDNLAEVYLYPSGDVPANVSVKVPHRSTATAGSGWWEASELPFLYEEATEE